MFNGVGTALITPFKDNGEIDYVKYEALLEYQIKNGVDALIVLGTTGESPTISLEERTKLTKIAVEKVDKKIAEKTNNAGIQISRFVSAFVLVTILLPIAVAALDVLNIDAITGGFNFQNAWTGGFLAAKAMTSSAV